MPVALVALLSALDSCSPGRRSPLRWQSRPLPPDLDAAADDRRRAGARRTCRASALALWVQPVDATGAVVGLESPTSASTRPRCSSSPPPAAALETCWARPGRWKTRGLLRPARCARACCNGSVVIRGLGRPEPGDGARVAAAAPVARRRRARDPRRHRARSRRLRPRPGRSPADFDNAPSEPYNVLPDALLLNYKLGDAEFPARPRGEGRPTSSPSRRWRASRSMRQRAPRAQGQLRRLARRPQARSRTAPRAGISAGAYPASCGAAQLAAGLCRPGQLRRAG